MDKMPRLQYVNISDTNTGWADNGAIDYGYVDGFVRGYNLEFRNKYTGEIDYRSAEYVPTTIEDYYNPLMEAGYNPFEVEEYGGWEMTGRAVFRGYGVERYSSEEREMYIEDADAMIAEIISSNAYQLSADADPHRSLYDNVHPAFDYRRNSTVAKLVCAYEEASGIEEKAKFTSWFGDLALYIVEDHVSNAEFNERVSLALTALGLNSVETYLSSKYANSNSWNIVADMNVEKKTLATRLVDFYKNYDLYEYRDSGMDDEEAIKNMESALQNPEAISTLLVELNEIAKDVDLDENVKSQLNTLIEEVTQMNNGFDSSKNTIEIEPINETLSPKEQLRQRLENGVRSVIDSENFKDWLNTGSTLFSRGYSFNNALLIWSQNKTASYVMSYEKWKEFGRNVAQGAKGIKIYVPIIANEKYKGGLFKSIRKALDDTLNKDSFLTEASYSLGSSRYEFTMNRSNGLMGLRYNGKEQQIFGSIDEAKRFVDRYIVGKVPIGFTVGTVFDVSDTIIPQYIWTKKFNKSEIAPDANGNPVKNKKGETRIFNTAERQSKFRTSLDLHVPAQDPAKMQILFDALASLSAKKGVPVSVVDKADDEVLAGGASGYFSRQFTEETPNGFIVIASELPPTEKCSVLLHEMGHSDLHRDLEKLANEIGEQRISREMREVQAEAVAYSTASAFGIETDTSSFAYLAVYSRGFELQDFQKSLDVIYNESKKLAVEIEKELNERGYDLEFNEISKEKLSEEELKDISVKYLELEVAKNEGIESALKELPSLARESVGNTDRVEVLRYQNELLTAQKAELELMLDLIVELNDAPTRELQDIAIAKLEASGKRIAENEAKIDSLSEQYISLAKSSEQTRDFKKEPLKVLESMKADYPQLSALTEPQLQYISKSKFVADEFSKLLKKEPARFVEKLLERADLISKVASKNGTFIEINNCEQWTDEVVFAKGTLCSPKNAEKLISGYEAQFQGFRREAESRGEYFPYTKCSLSVYSTDKKGNINVVETRVDIGDGSQKGLKDHLSSFSFPKKQADVVKNFSDSMGERADKKKTVVQDLSKPTVEQKRVEPKSKGKTREQWGEEIITAKEQAQAEQATALGEIMQVIQSAKKNKDISD